MGSLCIFVEIPHSFPTLFDMKTEKWPREIKKGSFTAKVYRKSKLTAGREYQSFRLSYYVGALRKQKDFASYEDAEQAAHDAATALGVGRHDILSFTAQDRQEYDASTRLLEPLGLNLYVAVNELIEARRKLPPGVSLAEAVSDYAKRHPANAPRVTVAEAVAKLCDERENEGCAEAYTRKLRGYLARFADAFRCQMSTLTGPRVADWLRELRSADNKTLGNRTRLNYFGSVVTLARYAVSRHWLPREVAEEIAALPMPRAEALEEVGTFAPDEIGRILNEAPDDIRATLALGAFAGLRTEEICRLEWSDVKLSERVIVVGAEKAKTRSRRVVPMTENLAAWIAPLVKASGHVDPSPNSKALTHRWNRIAAKCGIPWKHNALRHSFISYRLAVTSDPARVAFEAGNSPQMIHAHYKALVTQADGERWFKIAPQPSEAVVLPMAQRGEHAA
jgi:integrase